MAISALVALSTLALRRGMSAWEAAGISPGTAVTSGFEEESLFALWRATHHQPVYLDPARPPFASAYFNWLFYAAYAAPLRSFAFDWKPAGMIRAGRLLTTVGAALGALILFVALRHLLPTAHLLCLAMATAVFFGPLAGWWPFTVRPDMGALLFEVAGIVVFLAVWRSRPRLGVVASTLLFFAAWSFKQTYLCGLATVAAFLLLERRWWLALGMLTGSAALWAAVLGVMGPQYRINTLQTAVQNVFSLESALQNLRDAGTKCLPLLGLAAAASLSRHRELATTKSIHDTRRLALLGLVISTPFAFFTAAKIGAVSNYFFTVSVFLALYAAAGMASRVVSWPTTAALGLMTLFAILPFTGLAGQATLRRQTDELATLWQSYQKLPEPRFSADHRLAFPWLNPHSPTILIAFHHTLYLQPRHLLENGGPGGMFERGEFAALLLPANVREQFLQGRLDRYERGRDIGKWTIYLLGHHEISPAL